MGNRFAGVIEKGAMPFLHKYLGNPVLSFLGRKMFRTKIRDFHCGMRAFRKDKISLLGLQATGMEFATELVVKATFSKLTVFEVPVNLYRDGRNRPPHLRTWRDGWRHLRFMLALSPWRFQPTLGYFKLLLQQLAQCLSQSSRPLWAIYFQQYLLLGVSRL
jgi:hypothetical protein